MAGKIGLAPSQLLQDLSGVKFTQEQIIQLNTKSASSVAGEFEIVKVEKSVQCEDFFQVAYEAEQVKLYSWKVGKFRNPKKNEITFPNGNGHRNARYAYESIFTSQNHPPLFVANSLAQVAQSNINTAIDLINKIQPDEHAAIVLHHLLPKLNANRQCVLVHSLINSQPKKVAYAMVCNRGENTQRFHNIITSPQMQKLISDEQTKELTSFIDKNRTSSDFDNPVAILFFHKLLQSLHPAEQMLLIDALSDINIQDTDVSNISSAVCVYYDDLPTEHPNNVSKAEFRVTLEATSHSSTARLWGDISERIYRSTDIPQKDPDSWSSYQLRVKKHQAKLNKKWVQIF